MGVLARGSTTSPSTEASDVLRVLVKAMSMQGGADAQKKFKGVAEIVAIVAIESVRLIIDCELGFLF